MSTSAAPTRIEPPAATGSGGTSVPRILPHELPQAKTTITERSADNRSTTGKNPRLLSDVFPLSTPQSPLPNPRHARAGHVGPVSHPRRRNDTDPSATIATTKLLNEGHAPFLERPGEFTAALGEFLDSLRDSETSIERSNLSAAG